MIYKRGKKFFAVFNKSCNISKWLKKEYKNFKHNTTSADKDAYDGVITDNRTIAFEFDELKDAVIFKYSIMDKIYNDPKNLYKNEYGYTCRPQVNDWVEWYGTVNPFKVAGKDEVYQRIEEYNAKLPNYLEGNIINSYYKEIDSGDKFTCDIMAERVLPAFVPIFCWEVDFTKTKDEYQYVPEQYIYIVARYRQVDFNKFMNNPRRPFSREDFFAPRTASHAISHRFINDDMNRKYARLNMI